MSEERIGISATGRRPVVFIKVADLVLFDPQAIGDRADYEHPRRFAHGVEYVIIRGRVVKSPSGLTGARPGIILRPS
jgi:N-acyl-D-amino-acid deacylase